MALAVAWRNLHNFFTNPALVVPALLFPLFFFTAFAGGLSGMTRAPASTSVRRYTAFQFVFVLMQASAFGGVSRLRHRARLRVGLLAPADAGRAPPRGIVVGYWLAGIMRALFTIVVVTTVALIAGMKLQGGGVDLPGLYMLALP